MTYTTYTTYTTEVDGSAQIACEAVRAAAFRWMPRMLNTEGWTCMAVDDAGKPTLWADDGGGWVEEFELPDGDAIPDGDDPATRGCFLELVREAYSDPTIHTVPRPGHDGNVLWGLRRWDHTTSVPMMRVIYENEFKLLVVALCAAPESEVG